MAQQPRRRLRDVELTGWRHGVRLLLLLGAIGAAAGALLALPFEHHTVRYDTTETILSETEGVPFLILLAILATSVWSVRGGFPRGVLAGVASGGGAFLAAVVIALEHILSEPIYNGAGTFALLCLPLLVLLGAATIVAELLLHWRERRRLEAEDPVFATARVVSHSKR